MNAFSRCARGIAAVLLGAGLLGGWLAAVAHAGSQAGHWGATELQVQSLWPLAQTVTVTLRDPGGGAVWSQTVALAPYATNYVQPSGVAPGVTGTLVLDAGGAAAGAIAHLEEPPLEPGSDVYELRPDASARPLAWLPALERDVRPGRGSSRVAVHNRAGAPITATLDLYDANGVLTPTVTLVVTGSVTFDLARVTSLPDVWSGAGVVRAAGAVLVEVVQDDNGAYDGYLGLTPDEVGPELVLPWVAPSQAGLITSTIAIANPSPNVAHVTVQFTTGGQVQLDLPPLGSRRVPAPAAGAPLAARINSDLPVAARTRMVSLGAQRQGTLSYPAFALVSLAPRAALPLLYSGYLGWSHVPPAGAVRVYNAGTVTAAITLTYRSASPDLVAVYTAGLAPGAFTDQFPPPAGAPHWSLSVLATQPVAAVAVGFRSGTAQDHWFAYRGRPVVPVLVPQLYLPGLFLQAVSPGPGAPYP